jgi:nicotinamidase-related amidase
MNTHLLVIDAQNDFCVAGDEAGHRGSLVVPGALDDMRRLAGFIADGGPAIDAITLSLDSHPTLAIERPAWWRRNSDGARPAPFTMLAVGADGRSIRSFRRGPDGPEEEPGEWAPANPAHLAHGGPTGGGALGYLRALGEGERRAHVVWPEHCVFGTWGWCLVDSIAAAVGTWERDTGRTASRLPKGRNPWTEHFSILRAEVPDPADPDTQLNLALVQSLAAADRLLVAGEALSHCVPSTVDDLLQAAPDLAVRTTLLVDATSPVPGFEAAAAAFVARFRERGGTVARCGEVAP